LFFFLIFVGQSSCYVAKAGLELKIILPQPPERLLHSASFSSLLPAPASCTCLSLLHHPAWQLCLNLAFKSVYRERKQTKNKETTVCRASLQGPSMPFVLFLEMSKGLWEEGEGRRLR
jgi:hypothetical protein